MAQHGDGSTVDGDHVPRRLLLQLQEGDEVVDVVDQHSNINLQLGDLLQNRLLPYFLFRHFIKATSRHDIMF